MWPFKRKPKPEPKPDYWVSPFYRGWRCAGCDMATGYDVKERPICCAGCGCETLNETIGRERKQYLGMGFYTGGRFFPRGLDVPTE